MERKKAEKTRPPKPVTPATKKKSTEVFDDAMRQKAKEEWETAKLTPYKLTPALRTAISKAAGKGKNRKNSLG